MEHSYPFPLRLEVELLRACAMYKLPKALLDLAQTVWSLKVVHWYTIHGWYGYGSLKFLRCFHPLDHFFQVER